MKYMFFFFVFWVLDDVLVLSLNLYICVYIYLYALLLDLILKEGRPVLALMQFVRLYETHYVSLLHVKIYSPVPININHLDFGIEFYVVLFSELTKRVK